MHATAYPAPRVVHGKSVQRIRAEEVLLPPVARLRVVPFLGLAVVHRRGALGVAWSMWSTTDFHWKSTVRGEAYSWIHGRSKEVPPYYVQNNDSST